MSGRPFPLVLSAPSGGGKTTVLRLIGGQQRAQQGQVLFDGQEVGALDAAGLFNVRRRMGMLFQFGALFTDLSIFENVAFGLRRRGIKDVNGAVEQVLALVELLLSLGLTLSLVLANEVWRAVFDKVAGVVEARPLG